jgi:hypothetical protein
MHIPKRRNWDCEQAWRRRLRASVVEHPSMDLVPVWPPVCLVRRPCMDGGSSSVAALAEVIMKVT